MITITLPDKSQRTFETPPTGLDIAKSISEGFAATCVAMKANSRLKDISASIDEDSDVVFLTTRDEEALEIMRHSAAHVMAQAVLALYPKAKLTIGPVIEGGFYYDFDMQPLSEDDFARIEDEMRRIVNLKLPITRQEMSKEKALALYAGEPYKREIVEQLEDSTVSVYAQEGFFDLCRGPHVPHTGFVKAFKLMKVSGAYWRGDSSKAQLQRIYGTAFFDKKELKKYLDFLEEAKKRDHRKWGQRLDLFSFHEEAPGMPFFHANGMAVWNALLDYWRHEHRAAGYVETKTPLLLQKSLWVKSGHWENYRENMYTSVIDEVEYAIKPMNCPGGMLLYASGHHSYKDLPLRSAEIGFVHRHELSGVLSGLFRVRAFHQDDAHIFMTPEQMESEILGVLHLVERIYSTFGLGFHLELSTRPEKSIGTDAHWERATKGLTDALAAYGHDYKINEGDGAFYGPKIDIHIKDAIGRTWQCATVQLDMSLPERFDLYYIGPDNEKHRPIMIHRVIYGSVERFFGILVEHFAGRFPLWMAPVQASVLAMNDSIVPYAAKVRDRLAQQGLRAELDDRAESINKKVRDAQLKAVPLMLTIGEKEKENNTLALRTLDGKVRYNMNWDSFMDKVLAHIAKRGIEPDPFGEE
jgi:threonyl-tRNA synthetase